MVSEQVPAAEVENTEAAAPVDSTEDAAPKAEEKVDDEAPVVEDVKEDEEDEDDDDDEDDADDGNTLIFLTLYNSAGKQEEDCSLIFA